MILKKSMPFLFIPLFISLVACLGDQNDITNESQVNLLDDFNYTAYWENNEQVQERCVKSDSLCIEEHWVNIGEPAGLSYLPVEEISSSSHSSSSALILSSSVISNNSEAASSSAEVSSSSEEISSSSELSSSSSIEEISSSNVVIQTVARPTFSIEGGIYTSTQSVAISTTTAEATIYYTKNGSMPTTSSLVYNSSIVYNGPISVSTSQTLRAIAVKTAWDNSLFLQLVMLLTLPQVHLPTTAILKHIKQPPLAHKSGWQKTLIMKPLLVPIACLIGAHFAILKVDFIPGVLQ
jgi:hypothetical protein